MGMVRDKRTGRMRMAHKQSSAQKAALRRLHSRPEKASTIMAIKKGLKRALRTGHTESGRRSLRKK